MAAAVKAWLDGCGLEQYHDTFIDNGYDDPEAIADLEASDLQHMQITDEQHCATLLQNAGEDGMAQLLSQAAAAAEAQPRERHPTLSLRSRPQLQVKAAVEIFVEKTAATISIELHAKATVAECLKLVGEQVTTSDPDAEPRLLEVYDWPPMERWLREDEFVFAVLETWPTLADCKVQLRLCELSGAFKGDAKAQTTGPLDKRGGKHKSWKSRHFRLEGTTLKYYKAEPKNIKQAEKPIGAWPLKNALVYFVRKYPRAPRPALCFCLKPFSEPLWPSTKKEMQDAFDNSCKFMCGVNEISRANWVAALLAAQKEEGEAPQLEVDESQVRERKKSQAALSHSQAPPSSSADADGPPVLASALSAKSLPLPAPPSSTPSSRDMPLPPTPGATGDRPAQPTYEDVDLQRRRPASTRAQGGPDQQTYDSLDLDVEQPNYEVLEGVAAVGGDDIYDDPAGGERQRNARPSTSSIKSTRSNRSTSSSVADDDAVHYRRNTLLTSEPNALSLSDDPTAWDSSDVLRWLKENDLEDFRQKFYSNGFVGSQLLALSATSFKRLGFSEERCAALSAAIMGVRRKYKAFKDTLPKPELPSRSAPPLPPTETAPPPRPVKKKPSRATPPPLPSSSKAPAPDPSEAPTETGPPAALQEGATGATDPLPEPVGGQQGTAAATPAPEEQPAVAAEPARPVRRPAPPPPAQDPPPAVDEAASPATASRGAAGPEGELQAAATTAPAAIAANSVDGEEGSELYEYNHLADKAPPKRAPAPAPRPRPPQRPPQRPPVGVYHAGAERASEMYGGGEAPPEPATHGEAQPGDALYGAEAQQPEALYGEESAGPAAGAGAPGGDLYGVEAAPPLDGPGAIYGGEGTAVAAPQAQELYGEESATLCTRPGEELYGVEGPVVAPAGGEALYGAEDGIAPGTPQEIYGEESATGAQPGDELYGVEGPVVAVPAVVGGEELYGEEGAVCVPTAGAGEIYGEESATSVQAGEALYGEEFAMPAADAGEIYGEESAVSVSVAGGSGEIYGEESATSVQAGEALYGEESAVAAGGELYGEGSASVALVGGRALQGETGTDDGPTEEYMQHITRATLTPDSSLPPPPDVLDDDVTYAVADLPPPPGGFFDRLDSDPPQEDYTDLVGHRRLSGLDGEEEGEPGDYVEVPTEEERRPVPKPRPRGAGPRLAPRLGSGAAPAPAPAVPPPRRAKVPPPVAKRKPAPPPVMPRRKAPDP